MTLDAATERQNQAAEPRASTWLSANAGSGKTRVLTDRVARLLLEKVDPQNILCLTYTKAAASEMQNRLFKRLGEWAMKDDALLASALSKLGVPGVEDRERLSEARRLFARAIETPGGLRIQTIHSFCASLLRRFPLEAGVSPQFVEMDDRAAVLLREDVVDALASGPGQAELDAVAVIYTGEDLVSLTGEIVKHQEQLRAPVAWEVVAGWYDIDPALTETDVMGEVFEGNEQSLIQGILPVLREVGSKTDQTLAARLEAINWSNLTELFEVLSDVFLTKSGAKVPFSAKIGSVPTKSTQTALGGQMDALDALMERVEAGRERLLRVRAARNTAVLYDFSQVFLTEYEARKARHGWLDFDDLILKTRALLGDTEASEWVLYRLDGGLDHILVDEAQDTSPAQWQVIERLAQEFTSGLGARDGKERTIFVVGDKKQSIYSFQGADPAEFDRMREAFAERLGAVGVGLMRKELEYSFRSSEAVLRLVDVTTGGQGGASFGEDVKHRAFHDDLPGRVDLWPPVPEHDKPAKPNWYDPVDIRRESHHTVILAKRIAEAIAEMIETGSIPCEKGGSRRIRAGDFLILVRRRSALFEEIIRACKAADLPVAGADRLKLGAELAVKDLAAVLAFLGTSEDDLSLAAALRSPLFGWSEEGLFDLAAERGKAYLWEALRGRAEEFPETMEILDDLRDNADFLRPYDLIERILIRHDGRRRLLARLGREAEDGIDALLSQALAYERMEIPSLTGFLAWLETEEVEIKRQMDAAGDLIRVMTVHGAKGLEAPIVILPDTGERSITVRDEIVKLPDGQPAWKASEADRPGIMRDAYARMKAAQQEEAQRLFYVATTRAETWLIVACAGKEGKHGESWYKIAEEGMQHLGAVPVQMPTGQGLRYQYGEWPEATDEVTETPTDAVEFPDWARARLAPVEKVEMTRSPSELGGAKVLGAAVEAGDEEVAKRHGRRIHRLLELLPGAPQAEWGDLAERLLSIGPDGGESEEAAADLAEARAVLDAPELAHLFDPSALAEVDLSAALPDLNEARIHGTVDRLILSPDRVLAVDFKTNMVVPDRPADVPEGLLRQMGAYQQALEAIYPDRTVETAILWTRGPSLMALPHEIVSAALQRASTS